MTKPKTTMAFARVLFVAGVFAAAACGSESAGTSVRISLSYADALSLDTADVTLAGRTLSSPISHELLLLVSDDLAGQSVPLEVWGRKDNARAAFGSTTLMPRLGETVDTLLELTACAPKCVGNTLMSCGEPVSCALGCSENGDPHCVSGALSNGVDPSLADNVTETININEDADFHTDTGEISGSGAPRAAGEGVKAGIGYYRQPSVGGGPPLAIFVFHTLTIGSERTIRFVGSRVPVLLVRTTATITGTIDVSAGPMLRQREPGIGGGTGGVAGTMATGCGAGGPGDSTGAQSGGGGGGGGGAAGGRGGSLASLNGSAGMACVNARLEPLVGGSGGGAGGFVASGSGGGGGGGGALQLSALGDILITGTINAGGAGGEPGQRSSPNAGGGGGGGGGGGILLESPTVLTVLGSFVTANGGGGGGGGGELREPTAGQNGQASLVRALGGDGSEVISSGGVGGAVLPAGDGGDGNEGGGGGGAAGYIVIRSNDVTTMGVISPRPSIIELPPP